MVVFDSPAFDDHEGVVFFEDKRAGLRAIVAIHDTALGPAVGGCRMWPYASVDEAVFDVLRLSQGMSGKAALAGLPFGGGKAVIMGDPASQKSDALFRAFGQAIDGLGGRYYTAEDVGTSPQDMDRIGQETPYVLGRPGHGSGDPSPFTALGVVAGIEAAARHRFGRIALKGLSVAVQGLGNVGLHLARSLMERGANVIGADAEPYRATHAARELGIRIVGPDEILRTQADVLAPCALGGILNDRTIPELGCGIVAGAANNQLLEPRHGEMLREIGILYAPDYVINAGGLINVTAELSPGGYARERAMEKVRQIPKTLDEIFVRAASQALATSAIADQMARQILNDARGGAEHQAGSLRKATHIALAS